MKGYAENESQHNSASSPRPCGGIFYNQLKTTVRKFSFINKLDNNSLKYYTH